ncbi:MAG: hypothetical protein WBA85_20380 [Brucella anthropi]
MYTPPAGTKAAPNTTIRSAPYNSLVDDLTADANAARPITAGGTGATNATKARENLGALASADILAAPLKDTPVDGDSLVMLDSEDDGKLKRTLWSKIKGLVDGVYLKLTGGTLTGEILSTAANSYRLANGSGKSLILRKDGTDFYLLVSDTPDGAFNALRPFQLNLATGKITTANGFRSTVNLEVGSGLVETNGNLWGPAWNNGSLLAWLGSTSNRAYPRRSDGGAMNFYWSGQGGQPTWVWGGTDGTNMYVYNPANFSVNYANSAGSAGNANTVGGADRGYLEGVSYNYGYSRTRDYLMAEGVPVGVSVYRSHGNISGSAGDVRGLGAWGISPAGSYQATEGFTNGGKIDWKRVG